MMNIRAPNNDDNDSTKCLPGLERFEDAIPPSTARGSKDLIADEGTTPPLPPMESDDLESEEVDATFTRTLNDASSFAHQVHHLPKNPFCRHGVVFKTKASPARVRKISLSEQASITEAFQGLQFDHKYRFGRSTPFHTVRDVFTGWIYAYPVADKSKLEVERVLRHIIGARSSYKILVSDSAPELLAENNLNFAHCALTAERPQQSGHVERSNALISEPAGIDLQQSGSPKEISWKAAVRTAATALSLITRAGRKSAFEVTFETPSWLFCQVLPSLGTFGCYLGANCREHWKCKALEVSEVQNNQIQELDDFEGELESEIEDKNNPVGEVSEILKLDLQPPATESERDHSKVKRDEKVAEWHMKILVKPGVERTDWPDGVPVSAPSRSQRPPYISSMVWTSLHPSQRILETDRWKDWAEKGSQTYKLSLDIGNTAQVRQKLSSHHCRLDTHRAQDTGVYYVRVASDSPELSGKRTWISEQRADPSPAAQLKAKVRWSYTRSACRGYE
eukprot:6490962-Amphidinium_carterae.1